MELILVIALLGSIVIGVLVQLFWSVRRTFCQDYARINPELHLKSSKHTPFRLFLK
jgi:hypothetical protein